MSFLREYAASEAEARTALTLRWLAGQPRELFSELQREQPIFSTPGFVLVTPDPGHGSAVKSRPAEVGFGEGCLLGQVVGACSTACRPPNRRFLAASTAGHRTAAIRCGGA